MPATTPTGGRGDCCSILLVGGRLFRERGPSGKLGQGWGEGRSELGVVNKRGLGSKGLGNVWECGWSDNKYGVHENNLMWIVII